MNMIKSKYWQDVICRKHKHYSSSTTLKTDWYPGNSILEHEDRKTMDSIAFPRSTWICLNTKPDKIGKSTIHTLLKQERLNIENPS